MCKKCGKPITETTIYRTSTCSSCGADLHSCINCKFYAPGSHYDCHETIDELVKDKERANFCDNFSVRKESGISSSNDDAQAKARDAFNSLFS